MTTDDDCHHWKFPGSVCRHDVEWGRHPHIPNADGEPVCTPEPCDYEAMYGPHRHLEGGACFVDMIERKKRGILAAVRRWADRGRSKP